MTDYKRLKGKYYSEMDAGPGVHGVRSQDSAELYNKPDEDLNSLYEKTVKVDRLSNEARKNSIPGIDTLDKNSLGGLRGESAVMSQSPDAEVKIKLSVLREMQNKIKKSQGKKSKGPDDEYEVQR